MPDATIRVEGADQLRRALRYAADAGLKKQLAKANKDAAQLVVDRALPNVPVRSGRLRKSVRALGSQRSGRAVAGRSSVKYAAAIHWGRKRGNVGRPPGNYKGLNPIKGRPFLYDAAHRNRARVIDQYEQAIRALVVELRRRMP